MNFRFAIIFSLFIHCGGAVSLLYYSGGKVMLADIADGKYTFSEERDDDPANGRAMKKSPARDLRIIIAGDSFLQMPPGRKKMRKSRRAEKDRKEEINFPPGALHARAKYNALNNPPLYPYIARRMKVQGKVTLKIEVLPGGRAGDVSVAKSSGHKVLDEAAVKAAGEWTFFRRGEYLLDGAVEIYQDIEFVLRGN